MKITNDHAGKWWVADVNVFFALTLERQLCCCCKGDRESVRCQARPHQRRVRRYVDGSGSIPVTLTFQEALGKSVLLLPMGRADDGAHSINEKLDRSNYLNGIKLLATYLDEISKI